jgi:hypothetical protein
MIRLRSATRCLTVRQSNIVGPVRTLGNVRPFGRHVGHSRFTGDGR